MVYTVYYVAGHLSILPKISKLSRSQKLLFLCIALVLVFDYVAAVYVKSPLSSDAPVHVSRIRLIAEGHFTISDPYFGNHGVVDARYSTNLLLGLEAVATKLLRTPAINIWYYSYGFYRLVVWAGLFSLAIAFTQKRQRKQVAYILLILAPFMYNLYFRLGEFPDRIVLAWTALFIIGVLKWAQNKGALLMLFASILIAVTHPLNAAMALAFILLVAVISLLMKRIERGQILAMLCALPILAAPVILNLLYPNRIAVSDKAFNAGAISGNNYVLTKYGPFTMARLPELTLALFGLAILYGGFILFASKLKHLSMPWAKTTLFVLILVAAFLAYVPVFITVIGYITLFRTAKRERRVILVAATVFYWLVIYNPLLMPIIGHRLPPWTIARFQEFNLFALLAPIVGWLTILDFPKLHLGLPKITKTTYVLAPIVIFVCIPLFYSTSRLDTVLSNSGSYDNTFRIRTATNLQKLAPQLKGQVVFTDDEDVAFMLPTVVPAYGVDTIVANYSPVANIAIREKCADTLAEKLNYTDFQDAGATRIITNRELSSSARLDDRLKAGPYAKLLKRVDGLAVYEITPQGAENHTTSSGVCKIPWAQ